MGGAVPGFIREKASLCVVVGADPRDRYSSLDSAELSYHAIK